jgi:hypothetical protein
MNEFKPSDNYDSLLRQARALYNICKSQEAQLSFLHKARFDHSAEEVARLKAELESEKQMNHQLTNELEPN